jgi:transcriptional regulator with XRE-family HTH domain
MNPSQLIRVTRRDAGLTQAQLAARLGTTQAAVARLERPGTNPTVATLDRALRAAGSQLELVAARQRPDVDEAQLAAHLRLTPAERVAAHDRAYRNVRKTMAQTRRVS